MDTPKAAIGIRQTPPMQPAKQAAPPAAPARSPEGSLLQETHLHGFHKGRREDYPKGFRHGAVFAFICVAVGVFFVYIVQSANRESNMIDSRVAVGAALSNAKLIKEFPEVLGDKTDERFPVVEDGK